MATSFEETAIVLRVVPYEDRHRIVTALSEKRGKITAIANNAVNSRRYGAALQPFAASGWRMAERAGANLYRLDEAILKRGYEGIRKHFEILTLASLLNDILLRIAPENEACLELFKLHSNTLALLEDWANEAETLDPIRYFQVLNGYFSKILQWNGTQPQLMRCLSCERSLLDFSENEELRASIITAGWVCSHCRHYRIDTPDQEVLAIHQKYISITQAALGDFYLALTHPIRKSFEVFSPNLSDQHKLFQFLLSLLQYHVPGFEKAPLQTLRFIPEFKDWIQTEPEQSPNRPNL